MKILLLALVALLFCSVASADGYDGYGDFDDLSASLLVAYGPICSPTDKCSFEESWQFNDNGTGYSFEFLDTLPLGPLAVPVPGAVFANITTILVTSNGFCAGPATCDFTYQYFLPYWLPTDQFETFLPFDNVVRGSYLSWVAADAPVTVPEPSTVSLAILGLSLLFAGKMLRDRYALA